MRTRVAVIQANTALQTLVYMSLIALLAAFSLMIQVQYTPISPMCFYAPLNPIHASLFRGLVRPSQLDSPPADNPAINEEAAMSAQALLDRWQPFITEASQRFAVPEKWIRDVIRVESGGRTFLFGKPITSGAGAMGLMQLMRDTYNEISTRNGLGTDPYNARDNILAGTAYLRELYTKYGYPFLFAAYNAGPGRLEDHLHKGHSLPAETRAYVRLATDGAVPASFGEAKVAARKSAKLVWSQKNAKIKHLTRVAA